MYADDNQLYISFSPTKSHSPFSIHFSTLDLVHNWFTNNRLCLNPSSFSIANKFLEPVNSVGNLGVILDTDMSLRHRFLTRGPWTPRGYVTVPWRVRA